MYTKQISLALLLVLSLTAGTISSNSKDAQVISKKVANILDQMTLAEKVGQMTQIDMRLLDDPSDIKTYHIGSILSRDAAPKAKLSIDWALTYDGKGMPFPMNSGLTYE